MNRKLTDYVLSSEHDDGKHKAVLFRDLLGITADRVDLLLDGLQQAAVDADVQPSRLDRYGQRYVLDFDLIAPPGRASVRAVWIVPSGQTLPRLVTCYYRERVMFDIVIPSAARNLAECAARCFAALSMT